MKKGIIPITSFIPYDATDTVPASLGRIFNVRLEGIYYLEYAILTITWKK